MQYLYSFLFVGVICLIGQILFDKSKKDLCKRLSQTYKSTYHSEINRASKDSNLWQILYQQVSMMIDKGKVHKEYDICI